MPQLTQKLKNSILTQTPEQLIRMWINATETLAREINSEKSSADARQAIELIQSRWVGMYSTPQAYYLRGASPDFSAPPDRFDRERLPENGLYAVATIKTADREYTGNLQQPWGVTPYSTGNRPLPKEGLFTLLEYHVGQIKGKKPALRRIRLTEMYNGFLPPVINESYMSYWGAPASSSRLKALSDKLSHLTINEQRRNNGSLNRAIREHVEDLNFLHDNYFDDDFEWPTLSIIDIQWSH